LARSVCSLGTLMTINAPPQRDAPKHYSIPFERIESLPSPLRFQMSLGSASTGDVRFERAATG
jgi:hypothetical protein